MGAIYGEHGWPSAAGSGERALALLAHRGAGPGGTWIGENVLLAMRPAAPVVSEGGCAALDGAIFNAPRLRTQLGVDGGDAELVLRAFQRWGTGFLERLNGAFAIALWDATTRTLLLARDRFGERPLYYRAAAERLVFASEIKAILADEAIPRRVDPRALVNFLTFAHSGAAVTMFEGIHKLPPGHLLRANGGAWRIDRWWDMEPGRLGASTAPEPELAHQVAELLDDAVRLRVPAAGPAAAFLSGGMDSAMVVARMQRHTTAPVHTFTLAYEEGGDFDESAHARATAAALGTEHHELRVGHRDLLAHLRELVYQYDEPLGIAAGFNFFMLARLVAEHADVVLTGDGGDELFGGYRRHVAEQAAPLYQRLPGAVTRRAIPAAMGRLPRLGRTRQILDVLLIADPARRTAAWLTVLTADLRAQLLSPASRAAVEGHDPVAAYASIYRLFDGAGERLNRQLYAELKAWLPDTLLEKTDKPMMARGVEARMPLFDHRLVELALQIPDRHKIRGRQTKRILRQASAGLVPEATLHRRKHGFTIPTDPWLRGPVAPYARDVLFDERTRTRGYFEPRVVERLFEEHLSGRRIWDRALWMLVNFELWHRVYLDGEGI
jgi:asparagine synthase (glutamine-hydrolysing)